MQKREKKTFKQNAQEAVASSVCLSRAVPKMPSYYWPLAAAFLAIVTAVIYYSSLHYEFQFDDLANITKHFNIRHYTLKNLFFSGSRWISYWINAIHYSIGKFDPFSYRVFNVCIHICNGLLIFFILSYALPRVKQKHFITEHGRALAFITAFLFLIHPVQTQTVSYVIQGQLEGVAAFFIFSMILCFLVRSFTQRSGIRALCTLSLFVLAPLSCGTKEIAIIAPALLVIIDWFFVAQGEWASLRKRLWLHISLFMIVTTIYCYLLKPSFFLEIIGLQKLARNNIGNVITHDPTQAITPGAFFISQFKVILHYLWMFIWPFNISVEYDWMISRSIFAPDCYLPFIALCGVCYAIFRLLRKHSAHIAAFGLVWFLVAIAPRSSFIPSSELLVDYKTYTASWGWLLILAAGLLFACIYAVRALKVLPVSFVQRTALPVVCVVLLVAPFGLFTVQRNMVWRTGIEFWANVLENAPGKARAYNNYGVELSQAKQQYREAIPYFRKAISMDKAYPDPWNNLAVAYAATENLDLAIDALKQGLSINPNYPEGYNNLAALYLKQKKYEQADQSVEIALKIRPYYGKAWFNKGRIYAEKGDEKSAWECFKNCCTKADLDDAFGFSMYGKASMAIQKYDDAIIAYKKVLEFQPNDGESAFNLGNAYFFKQSYDEAIHIYQALLKTSNDPRIWYNLGETYYTLGKEKLALECFDKIQQHKQSFPPMLLRMASCYEKMGNITKAQAVLAELATLPQVPEDVKKMGRGLLAQLGKKTMGATAKA